MSETSGSKVSGIKNSTTRSLIILNTCPDQETANKLATLLVEKRLAACVNIIPGLSSVYQWQGEIHNDQECLLIIKTSEPRYKAVEQELKEHHPYELPEIIAVPVEKGEKNYLNWIQSATNATEIK